ncbi:hypothetical protein FQN57_005489 [Myotisia sp. PD_48]|nr:hypothetical protein FQN57_005489 [Myotisia sp. PD_48]
MIGHRRPPLLLSAGGLALFVGFLYILFQLGNSEYPRNPTSYIHRSDSSLLDDAKNSTLGFERIYVINLPERTDRRDALLLMADLTGIKLTFIEGVRGNVVPDKALPPEASHATMKDATIGSWRGHLNALVHMLEHDVSSALIMEDDIDWDVRIKTQMRDYARASQALTQPLANNPTKFADSSFIDPRHNTNPAQNDLKYEALPRTATPRNSPYGDNWDVAWLGHCGVTFPNLANKERLEVSQGLPRGRVIRHNDETVAEHHHLSALTKEDDIRSVMPQHTRVYHHVKGVICSLAYGVSRRGAQSLLNEFGLKKFNEPYDLILRDACEGIKGRARHICLSVQPQLFNHHFKAGNASHMSDISAHEGVFEKSWTGNIRYSTRLNIPKLLAGQTDYDDQLPDKNPSHQSPEGPEHEHP